MLRNTSTAISQKAPKDVVEQTRVRREQTRQTLQRFSEYLQGISEDIGA